METSDHVVEFNIDPMKGTVFNDPANPVTIKLPFGEITLFDDNGEFDAIGNDVGWGFDELEIRGPKSDITSAPNVTINRTAALYGLGEPGYGLPRGKYAQLTWL